MTLALLGWDDVFAEAFRLHSDTGLVPARVVLEHRHVYAVLTPDDEFTARCTGRLVHAAPGRAHLPAVGDWVAIRPRPGEAQADVHDVLPRRTVFSRRAAGTLADEQVVASNVDTVLLVSALDHSYNLRRIERYLAVARESGAEPVVILNKADLHPCPAAAQAEVESIACGARVVALSATAGEGVEALNAWLHPGRTLAFLGSSGVGKSTLINAILGEQRQQTGAISHAVGKGRHTTTRRELLFAASGALLIDTPGMRELQLWDIDPSAIDDTFADVAEVVAGCRFSDCSHDGEPGCAVRAALDDESLDDGRWRSYLKLRREQEYAARRADPRLERQLRNEWRKLHKAQRRQHRHDLGGWDDSRSWAGPE